MRPLDLQVNINSVLNVGKAQVMHQNALHSQGYVMDEKLAKQHAQDMKSVKKLTYSESNNQTHQKETSLEESTETLLYIQEQNKRSYQEKKQNHQVQFTQKESDKDPEQHNLSEEHNWTA